MAIKTPHSNKKTETRLDKPFWRAILLFPPTGCVVAMMILAYLSLIFKAELPKYFLTFYLSFGAWLIVSVFIIYLNDLRKEKDL